MVHIGNVLPASLLYSQPDGRFGLDRPLPRSLVSVALGRQQMPDPLTAADVTWGV